MIVHVLPQNDSSLVGGRSFGAKFQRVNSTFETANLFGSILRSLRSEPGEITHASSFTNSADTQLELVVRNQETIMQNQHQLEYKLHKIISLLTPAHPVPDTFTSSPIVPAQPQTISVLSAPTRSASISDQQLNATNVRKLSYDQLCQMSKSTRSRSNFTALLLRELFQPTELQGKNIARARRKDQVDP